MIDLSYSLSSSWNERAADIDWGSADETTLRYRAFLGDQIFIVNGVDFSVTGQIGVVKMAEVASQGFLPNCRAGIVLCRPIAALLS